MTKDKALDLALEALGQLWLLGDEAAVIANPAITAIKQARSAPVQEPVAWWNGKHGSPVFAFERDTPGIGLGNPDATPLYTTPPAAQRQWVGLTDEEIVKVLGAVRESISGNVFLAFAQAIEAKLKEKNT